VVLLGRNVPDAHLAELTGDGVSYIVADAEPMNLQQVLETSNERFGIRRLLLEGGAGINGSFLAAGLVDEFCVLIAPAVDGGEEVQGIIAHEGGLAGKLQMSLISATTIGHGLVYLRYRVLPDSG